MTNNISHKMMHDTTSNIIRYMKRDITSKMKHGMKYNMIFDKARNMIGNAIRNMTHNMKHIWTQQSPPPFYPEYCTSYTWWFNQVLGTSHPDQLALFNNIFFVFRANVLFLTLTNMPFSRTNMKKKKNLANVSTSRKM